jgi:hypothetical protein
VKTLFIMVRGIEDKTVGGVPGGGWHPKSAGIFGLQVRVTWLSLLLLFVSMKKKLKWLVLLRSYETQSCDAPVG